MEMPRSLIYQVAMIAILILAGRAFYEYAIQKRMQRWRLEVFRYLVSFVLLLSIPFAENYLNAIFSTLFGIFPTAGINVLSEISNDLRTMINNHYQIGSEFAFKSGEIVYRPYLKLGQLLLSFVFCWAAPTLCAVLGTFVGYGRMMPYAHLAEYAQYHMYFVSSASLLYQISQTIVFLINFFRNPVFVDAFSIGVVLRLFPGLRKAGDVVISLALALYIIFPYSMSFFLSFYPLVKGEVLNPSNWLISSKYFPALIDWVKLGLYEAFLLILPNAAVAITVTFISQAPKSLELVEL